MSYETRLFTLMTESQQMNDYPMAGVYGVALLELLGVDNKPTLQRAAKGNKEVLENWQNYFQAILMSVVGRVKINIQQVRAKYGKSKDIPDINKQVKT